MDAIVVEVAWSWDRHIFCCRRTARNEAFLDSAPNVADDGRRSNDVCPHRQGDRKSLAEISVSACSLALHLKSKTLAAGA